jgi:hypothetical protein
VILLIAAPSFNMVTAVPGEPDRPAASGDFLLFPLATYVERLDSLIEVVWQGIEDQAPDALAKMADTARNIAERLDEMALEARQRVEQRERTSETASPSEPGPEPDHPPASPGGSGTGAAERTTDD